jgi:hypothetical protein
MRGSNKRSALRGQPKRQNVLLKRNDWKKPAKSSRDN